MNEGSSTRQKCDGAKRMGISKASERTSKPRLSLQTIQGLLTVLLVVLTAVSLFVGVMCLLSFLGSLDSIASGERIVPMIIAGATALFIFASCLIWIASLFAIRRMKVVLPALSSICLVLSLVYHVISIVDSISLEIRQWGSFNPFDYLLLYFPLLFVLIASLVLLCNYLRICIGARQTSIPTEEADADVART